MKDLAEGLAGRPRQGGLGSGPLTGSGSRLPETRFPWVSVTDVTLHRTLQSWFVLTGFASPATPARLREGDREAGGQGCRPGSLNSATGVFTPSKLANAARQGWVFYH